MQFTKMKLIILALLAVAPLTLNGCGSNDETSVPSTDGAMPSGDKPLPPGPQQALPQPGENKIPPGDVPKEQETVKQ